MDRTVTLSKHEMVIDRDEYDNLHRTIRELSKKTISIYAFSKGSKVVDTLIPYDQEEHMVTMEEAIDCVKGTDEYKDFIEQVDRTCAECLLMRGW